MALEDKTNAEIAIEQTPNSASKPKAQRKKEEEVEKSDAMEGNTELAGSNNPPEKAIIRRRSDDTSDE